MTSYNRKVPENVYLNIYDLNTVNDFLCHLGLGAHHSGIEIYGDEYAYGDGGGIVNMKPKSEPVPLRDSILLGKTWNSRQEIQKIISNMRGDYSGDKYNLLTRNCNCFSDAFCKKLFGHGIPNYVNRLASLGSCFEPLLRGNLERSPVSTVTQTSEFISFSGQGNKL